MPSKLSVYNGACLALGERKLASLSENVAMRRRLDTAWDNEAVSECLSRGLWNFALRSIELTYSPSITPDFGHRYAFDKPTDWVRTALVATDEFFRHAMTGYVDEASYWFADIDTIFVRYVSSDTQYGADLSLWPPNFTRFVEHSLAEKVAKSTTSSDADVEGLERKVKRLLLKARSTDAMDEATQTIPSRWAAARIASRSRENG
jgi:hypothetical protein